jgi:hypothetical protein
MIVCPPDRVRVAEIGCDPGANYKLRLRSNDGARQKFDQAGEGQSGSDLRGLPLQL